jgi:hypothetical protein
MPAGSGRIGPCDLMPEATIASFPRGLASFFFFSHLLINLPPPLNTNHYDLGTLAISDTHSFCSMDITQYAVDKDAIQRLSTFLSRKFFEIHKPTTQQDCDQKAADIAGGPINPTLVQGVTSPSARWTCI